LHLKIRGFTVHFDEFLGLVVIFKSSPRELLDDKDLRAQGFEDSSEILTRKTHYFIIKRYALDLSQGKLGRNRLLLETNKGNE